MRLQNSFFHIPYMDRDIAQVAVAKKPGNNSWNGCNHSVPGSLDVCEIYTLLIANKHGPIVDIEEILHNVLEPSSVANSKGSCIAMARAEASVGQAPLGASRPGAGSALISRSPRARLAML